MLSIKIVGDWYDIYFQYYMIIWKNQIFIFNIHIYFMYLICVIIL